jgi:hypothetical protein
MPLCAGAIVESMLQIVSLHHKPPQWPLEAPPWADTVNLHKVILEFKKPPEGGFWGHITQPPGFQSIEAP